MAVTIFRPPTAEIARFSPVITEINQKIADYEELSPLVIICGYFNLPGTEWETGSTAGGSGEQKLDNFRFLKSDNYFQ